MDQEKIECPRCGELVDASCRAGLNVTVIEESHPSVPWRTSIWLGASIVHQCPDDPCAGASPTDA